MFTVLVRCPVHTAVCTPMYRLPLSLNPKIAEFFLYFNHNTITKFTVAKMFVIANGSIDFEQAVPRVDNPENLQDYYIDFSYKTSA